MFHENTKVREILHLPGILSLVEKYTGKRLSMSTLKMGANLTLQDRWKSSALDKSAASGGYSGAECACRRSESAGK